MSATSGVVRVEDFDRKLSETDIYLQMLLNQVSTVKAKMEDPDMSPEAREKYATIVEKAVIMTESIKHSIVLLQVWPLFPIKASASATSKRVSLMGLLILGSRSIS